MAEGNKVFDLAEENLQQWKQDMYSYQKQKRTKIPFGKSLPKVSRVTFEEVKAKEQLFNPLLQTYAHEEDQRRDFNTLQNKRNFSLLAHMKNTSKYQKNFDIINLHSYDSSPYVESVNKKSGPVRNAYNVINNQKLPDFYFKNRDLILPPEREKKLILRHQKQYNIISNMYKENHQQRQKRQRQKSQQKIFDNYHKTHNYDAVMGKFYDKNKQEEYKKQLLKNSAIGVEQFQAKLPPSYVHRQPLIMDYTKPLPQTLKALDEKTSNAKKRFRKKYALQHQYFERNIEEDQKKEIHLKNKIHFGRILDEKAKQFDIINNTQYKESRAQDLFGKKPAIPNWQQYIKDIKPRAVIRNIKSQGFSS